MKEENHNDNLNRCRKAFEKIQHPLMLKTLQKMGLEGTYLNTVKENSHANLPADTFFMPLKRRG